MNLRTIIALTLTTGSLLLNARADITNGLVLYLPLDETNGTTFFDATTNGNNGTAHNFTIDSQWTTGRIGNGVSLNQAPVNNQYITVADNATLRFTNTLAFTIAVWVKAAATQINGAAVVTKGTGGTEEYVMDIAASRFRIYSRNSAGTATTVSATVGPNNNWQHVVGVYDLNAHTERIYLNGQLNNSTTNVALSSLGNVNTHVVSIGARELNGTSGYNLALANAVLDEVRMYNRALSATDVQALYAEAGVLPVLFIPLTPAQLWQRMEFQIINVPAGANPFDPDSIRLDVAFTLPSGRIVTVPAFWYQGYQRQLLSSGYESLTPSGSAEWRARFAPPEAGTYSLALTIRTNGQPTGSPVTSGFTVPAGAPLPGSGYVGVAASKEYLQTSDGQALRLVGHNVCWFDVGGTYDYDTWFAAMAAAGENYAHIWMCPWAFGIEDTPTSLTNYALPPAWQLDYVLQLAEQRGIRLELCLDYHGMFEVTPDYWGGNNYWPSNPYNVTNGGPCLNQNAFFTNATAKAIYQKRLRYLIGRYGYSPNLAAWQFFNEIDNVYAYLNPSDVAAWHNVMGGWMHTNDPFSHLVTTSLTGSSDRPEIWTVPTLDFATYHSYAETGPATRLSVVAQSFLQRYGKPVLIDEFGTDWRGWNRTNDPYLRGFRQGVWGGALGGSVGTAMSWYWENIQSDNVYPVYTALGAILTWTDWGQGVWTNVSFRTSKSSPVAIGLRGARESLLYVVAPGVAWPASATNASLPLQAGQSVTLTNWPAGSYYAAWYDPVTGAYVGRTQAVASNNSLNLPLPAFREDLAGILALSNAPIWGPTITTQPQSQTVNPGVNVTFSVTATGVAPLAYQWRFNTAAVSGATHSAYALTSVQLSNAGSYSVVVTNAMGSVTSAAALLALNVPPTITNQPQSQTVIAGQSVTFSVGAAGTAPLSYQWRFNAGKISGATASSYTANNVQTTSAGSYSVVVTNAYGSTNSANAVLTVLLPPKILIAPSCSAGGVFQFNLAGAAGSNYVIEASTNLTDWIPLETNPSPFTFTDTNAVNLPLRFYRALGSP